MSFVAFFSPSQPLEICEVTNLETMTAQQITEYFKFVNKALFIKTPKYIEIIPPNCRPFETYPQLLHAEKPKPYDRPDYTFMSLPENKSSIVSISVQPKTSSNIDIPSFYIDFDMQKDVSKKAPDVLKLVLDKFGFSVEHPFLSFSNSEISEGDSALTIIALAKKDQLFFNFDLSENELNKMKKRCMVIREIIETEKKYISDLDTIVCFWQKKMSKEIKMQPEDLDALFKGVGPIRSCHQNFLEQLTKCGDAYSSRVANVFIQFGPYFKISQQYIASFPNSVEIIHCYEKKSRFVQTMKRLANECSGRDLHSYLITPVQRMPRYILFLREILKGTPESHPDHELLEVAAEEIENVTKQIDITSKKMKVQSDLIHIQKDISQQFVFLDKQRELISETMVQIIDQKVSNGCIYFFDDLILIVKQSSVYKLVYECNASTFPHIHRSPDSLSIMIDVSDKPYSKRIFRSHSQYQVKFYTQRELEQWFASYHKHLTLLMLKSPSKIPLEFRNPPIGAPLEPFARAQLCRIRGSGTVIVVGASPSRGAASVFSIDLRSWGVKKVLCTLPALGGFTATTAGNLVVILNDAQMVRYDTKTDSVEALSVDIPARQFHTSVLYERSLVVFGGQSSNGSLLADVLAIDIDTGEVTRLFEPGRCKFCPSPRRDHSAVLMGSRMVVFGGVTRQGPNNELWSFDLKEHSWTQIPSGSLHPSAGHAAVALGVTLIALGGSGGNQHIDVRSSDAGFIEAFGNAPRHSSHLAVCPLREGDSLLVLDDSSAVYTTDFPTWLRTRDAQSRDTNWAGGGRRRLLEAEPGRVAQSDIGAINECDLDELDDVEGLEKTEKTPLMPMRVVNIPDSDFPVEETGGEDEGFRFEDGPSEEKEATKEGEKGQGEAEGEEAKPQLEAKKRTVRRRRVVIAASVTVAAVAVVGAAAFLAYRNRNKDDQE